MPYPQLELYIKEAILSDRVRGVKALPFWLRTASLASIVGGIGAGHMPFVVVGGLVLAVIESKRSGELMRAMRQGDPPVVYTLHRIRKWLPSGELEAALGAEACEILERCAGATRKIVAFHVPETMANRGIPSTEVRRILEATDAEMTAALRVAGRPLMFKLPADEAVLEELKGFCAGLEGLADALAEERKVLRGSGLPQLLQDMEDRKQARLELGS